MHSIAIGRDGALFVNSGSASNACQVQNRAKHSPGQGVAQGADYGWPYCYYDGRQAKHFLAPRIRRRRPQDRSLRRQAEAGRRLPRALGAEPGWSFYTAAHRPTGVAVGPDGALYISDDQAGRIWRVTRR